MFHSALHITIFLLGTAILRTGAAERWIIDTDAGADDAVAIFTFLAFEASGRDIELIGITTTHGNTNVDNVSRNVLKVLDTANRLDIPVYKGANQSLLITPPGDNFFGDDGFGDFEYPNPPPENGTLQTRHAVDYLVDVVRRDPGTINVLALSPLTNIAMATRMDPKFLSNLKSLYILGGSIQGIGNVRPGVEFNFYVDPDAAFIVLDESQKLQKKINLMSWEAALYAGIPIDWRMNVFGTIPTNVINIINKAENKSADVEELWISSDTIAVLWAIDPDFPAMTGSASAKVETSGSLTRGVVLVDHMPKSEDFQQLLFAVPQTLNVTYIQEKLFETFSNYTRIH